MNDIGSRNTNSPAPSVEFVPRSNVVTMSSSGYTISHRATSEVRIDPDKRPNFSNITDDYHLLENMIRYSKFCEEYNIAIPQMAQSLARAIGNQNGGRYSVLVYDYILAMPEYPPTLNGHKQALIGDGRWCNMMCYKNQLFGVCVFPVTDNVTFYFPEFPSYTPQAQQLIFTYGNKSLRLCPERKVLAFDFAPLILKTEYQPQPIMVTATLKRKINPEIISPIKKEVEEVNDQQKKSAQDFIQLD